jgi:polysaccharide pyruvyl transferase WcaK-like protein
MEVLHIPFSPVDDMFARSILKGRRVEFKKFTLNHLDVIVSLSQCNLLYATRFHAHIFGLIANVPTVSIAYSGKCETLWKDLGLDKDEQVNRMDIAMDKSSATDKLLSLTGNTLSAASLDHISSASYLASRQGVRSIIFH